LPFVEQSDLLQDLAKETKFRGEYYDKRYTAITEQNGWQMQQKMSTSNLAVKGNTAVCKQSHKDISSSSQFDAISAGRGTHPERIL
jgi:hypothetical protein